MTMTPPQMVEQFGSEGALVGILRMSQGSEDQKRNLAYLIGLLKTHGRQAFKSLRSWEFDEKDKARIASWAVATGMMKLKHGQE